MVLRCLLQDKTIPEPKETKLTLNVTLPGTGLIGHVVDDLFIPEAIKFTIDTGVQTPLHQNLTFNSNENEFLPIEVNRRILQVASLLSFLLNENLGNNFAFRMLLRPNQERTFNHYSYELVMKDIPIYFNENSLASSLFNQFQSKINDADNNDVLLSADGILGDVRRVYRSGMFIDILTDHPLEETELINGNRSGNVYLFNDQEEVIPQDYYEYVVNHFTGKSGAVLDARILPSNCTTSNVERLSLTRLPNGQYKVPDIIPQEIDTYQETFSQTFVLNSLTKLYSGLSLLQLAETNDIMEYITIRIMSNGTCVSIQTKYLLDFVKFKEAFTLDERKIDVTLERNVDVSQSNGMVFIDETTGVWCSVYETDK